MEVCPLALRGGSGRRNGQLPDRATERNGFSPATVAPAEYVCRNRDDRRVGVYVQTAYGASGSQLQEITGVGPATAEKIISYRQKTPFKNIEELKNVNGIGDKTFEKMKEQVTI